MSASATTPTQAAISQPPHDVAPRADEAFAEDGFAKVNDDGDIIRDKDKVIAKTTAVLVSEATANNNDECVARALDKESLYPLVFEHGPALDDPDDLEREAADYLAIYVWSLTSPSHQGRVQRALGDTEGWTDLVLCRRKINGAACVYVTRNDDMVADDYVLPGKEKMVKAADKTRRDMHLAAQRRGPALETRIKAELEDLAVKTAAALGVGTQRALGSGRE